MSVLLLKYLKQDRINVAYHCMSAVGLKEDIVFVNTL